MLGKMTFRVPGRAECIAALQRLRKSIRERLTPLLYAASSVATSMAQLVGGFLVIKWVEPEEVGLWQSVRLAQVYAFILLAGINNGLGRELPFALGNGDKSFADRLAGTAFFCVTLANVVVLLGGIACAIVFGTRGVQMVCAILAVTLVIGLAFYQHIFLLTFRSSDSFKRLTKIQWIEAGLSIATVPMVYVLGYTGMLARTVLIGMVMVALMFFNRPMRVKMRMDWQALKLLLKTGLPIFGLDYVKNSCGTLDRLVLLKLGGFKDVGIYALAGVALTTINALPSSLGSYLYPRMTFKFGQSGDARGLWKYGLRFVLLAVACTALAAVGAWLVLPHFVTAFIPKYLGGVRAAQIVLVAGIAGGVTIIADALWSIKAWRLMVIYQVTSSILLAMGPVLGIIFIGKSLEGVAWGVVIGAMGRCFLAVGLTYYGTHRGSSSEATRTSERSSE